MSFTNSNELMKSIGCSIYGIYFVFGSIPDNIRPETWRMLLNEFKFASHGGVISNIITKESHGLISYFTVEDFDCDNDIYSLEIHPRRFAKNKEISNGNEKDNIDEIDLLFKKFNYVVKPSISFDDAHNPARLNYFIVRFIA